MKGFEKIEELVSLSPKVKYQIRFGMYLGAVAGVLTVMGLSCCAFAVTEIINSSINTAFWIWLIVGGIGLIFGYLARNRADLITHEASFDLEVTLRQHLADVLAKLPLGDVQILGAGRIKKIMHDDVKGLHAAVADASPFVGVGVSQPLAALLILLFVQWKLFLLVCLMFPFIWLCMTWMTRDHKEQRQRYNQANEQINAAVIEFVQGMPVVRTFDSERVAFRRFTQKVDAFTEALEKWIGSTKNASKANSIVISPLPTLLIIILCSPAMLSVGWISLRDLVLGLMVGTMPVQAIRPLMYLSNMLNDARAAAHRICDILAMTPLAEPVYPLNPVDGDIEFENVSFSYVTDSNTTQALKLINLKIPSKNFCAVVGASGSGKSTLARLIPRFWDVSAGMIRLGGTDIRNIDSRALLQQVAFVFQEPFLISGTIAENIRLARPDATDDEIIEAAHRACAHDFISALEQGYETEVGERGSRLSGGQRQRITLARALISHAKVVILDEPTAWVDPESEEAIQKAIDELSQERTIIIIAHRLTTITHADQIVVLEKGEVIGTGRHEELMISCGRYTKLWQSYQATHNWHLMQARKVDNNENI
ncbi:ABC transporter ATP-binding protein [Salmonella enterica subsp. enterica]|uniref:ABC transporter ATP-binding protein n=1 Tax=Salmonella enterica TaxID=28901 RepID=UPI00193CF7B5|nr:ABC transporter ATP-binding protein [Salmonella enterica]EBK2664776.1 ABC transporter ATP-binding protein [Salmonella enterica subsp. enterica serovar Enteritidis]EDW1488859.1 ABC transporter ATP-binding protein [Salmonella enterica subsp. enterica serovar Hvittingfoss]EEH4118500.1 ABC transporter ATP-binding protein [Salmonella enterica subsp. enterica serovar Hvittingfoss]EEJ7167411.1 ABC transporter ATP-binding protein [Salmonella enterica subsp. enterica serovar Hvittingfoss]EEN5589760.